MHIKGCFSCFKQNHLSKNCRAFVRCAVCAKKHFPIMYPEVNLKNGKTVDNTESLLLNCTVVTEKINMKANDKNTTTPSKQKKKNWMQFSITLLL